MWGYGMRPPPKFGRVGPKSHRSAVRNVPFLPFGYLSLPHFWTVRARARSAINIAFLKEGGSPGNPTLGILFLAVNFFRFTQTEKMAERLHFFSARAGATRGTRNMKNVRKLTPVLINGAPGGLDRST